MLNAECRMMRWHPARVAGLSALIALTLALATGCARGPRVLPPEERQPIDRALVEYPAGFELSRFLAGLTAPSAIAFDKQRNALLVAESGADGNEPRIVGFNLEDGTSFPVYPKGRRLHLPLIVSGF